MINWKSAARAFLRRAGAQQAQLENALENLAPARDEELEEGFESWQDAARHWYRKVQEERVKSDVLRKSVEGHAQNAAGYARAVRRRDKAIEHLRELVRRRNRRLAELAAAQEKIEHTR